MVVITGERVHLGGQGRDEGTGWQDEVFMEAWLGARLPGFKFSSATSQLCDLKQVTSPLWALVSSSVTWASFDSLSYEVVVRIK